MATSLKPLVLPETYTGEGEWSQWICHFENVAAVNGWDDDKKLLWLKVRLTGRAQKASNDYPTLRVPATRKQRRP